MKIRTSGYQTLEWFIAKRQLGVLCTRVKVLTDLAVNCTKMRLVAGLHPDPLREL